MKKLIVNADDFGNTSGVNRGIIYGFKNGIITSASLMVKRAEAKEAAKLAKENPGLGIGLHFEIIADDNSIIRGLKKVLANFQVEKVKKQFYEQIEIFKSLMGKMPTHIDGHYHVHKLPLILPFILEFSRKFNIPLRTVGKVNFIDSFSGTGNPKNTSVENLIKILKSFPDGVSELMTHPGYSSAELEKISSMRDIREIELQILVSPEVKKVIKEEGIELISWRQIMPIGTICPE